MKKTKLCAVLAAGIMMSISLTGCSSCSRGLVDLKSDLAGGLHRVVRVYTATGDLIAEYEGKIDLEVTDGGRVKFDFDGKRYIYYNCLIETIADID